MERIGKEVIAAHSGHYSRCTPGGAEGEHNSLTRDFISSFRRDVDKIRALLGYYAASSGNRLPTFRETYRSHIRVSRSLLGYYAASSGNRLLTFRDNLSVPSSRVKKFLDFFTLEDGTDTSCRNVGKGLPLDAA